ncbi:MAG: nucleotidyltransferase family protein [Alphaproteobacteria bacterium]
MNTPHTAIVLAAGLGTRMKPLTDTLPKPLIEVAGKPLIDWCLDWLSLAGVARAVVNVSYMAEQMEAHLAQRARPRVSISREETPLETGGGVMKALPLLGRGPFVAMNSDAIFPPSVPHPLQKLGEAWRDELDFLMLLVPRERALGREGKGDFIQDKSGRVRWPQPGEEAPYVFSGVEIVHPRVFEGCTQGAFPMRELWQRSEQPDGWHSRIRSVVHDGPWLSVGDPGGLKTAEEFLVAR